MNKNIVIGAAILFIAATGWLIFSQNKAIAPNSQGIDNGQNQTAQNTGSFSGTLIDLMNRKASMKCTASLEMEGKNQTETIYSDGKNMRAEIAVNLPTGTTNSYVLVRDDWEYMWSDAETTGNANSGIKVQFTEADRQRQQELAATNPNQGNEAQKTMDFNCQPWVADAAQFEIPGSITFQDMTASMQAPAPVTACEACTMIPSDEAQTQCKQANKCSEN